MTEGFLVIDKESGMSSHDVVARVRKATGVKKVGHAGTLDPMATGVVVVAIGRVTRLIRFIQEFPKEYVTTGLFGVATDSLDADGAILEREPMEVEEDDVREAMKGFLGPIEQIPPMVSALKVGGERLYEIARRGETIERAPRPVTIHELELLDFVPGPYPEVQFRIVCSKGTYVRTLVDDIARALGGRAHLTALRRTRVGSLDLAGALPIGLADRYHEFLISPAEALSEMPSVKVDPETASGVANGLKFVAGPLATIPIDEPTTVLDGDGRLLAVYMRDERRAKPEVVVS